MLNLNTKKCLVEENGKIEWIMGSFGSKVSMLYPLSILNGENAKCEFTGISFAGIGQNLDTGIKVICNAPHTSVVVDSKSISKDGGICTFRSNVLVKKQAKKSKIALSCESLMMDSISRSDTIPVNTLNCDDVEFAHEAKIGKISEEAIYYLMSRGLTESEAKALIVRGFADPIAKVFPVEYAVEMNRLIDLELEGTIG
jgi:Fe-S cluster assembly protein SufB